MSQPCPRRKGNCEPDETKERPRFDPLIVHLPALDWLERVAVVDHKIRSMIDGLTNAYWPGPLTLVLPKTETIPSMR